MYSTVEIKWIIKTEMSILYSKDINLFLNFFSHSLFGRMVRIKKLNYTEKGANLLSVVNFGPLLKDLD